MLSRMEGVLHTYPVRADERWMTVGPAEGNPPQLAQACLCRSPSARLASAVHRRGARAGGRGRRCGAAKDDIYVDVGDLSLTDKWGTTPSAT